MCDGLFETPHKLSSIGSIGSEAWERGVICLIDEASISRMDETAMIGPQM
jgi:hypothetical protein